MRLSSPQRRLLKEGELFGYYVKPGTSQIDQLIALVESHYSDWDVSDPKFLKFFYTAYPRHANYSMNSNAIISKLMTDLELVSIQQPELIKILKKKLEDQEIKPTSPQDELDKFKNELLKSGFRIVGWPGRSTYVNSNPKKLPSGSKIHIFITSVASPHKVWRIDAWVGRPQRKPWEYVYYLGKTPNATKTADELIELLKTDQII